MAAPSQMPPQLRKSWLTGKVAVQIVWGTPGDFTRCVAAARRYKIPKRMRNGMCATLHRSATGKWPAEDH